MSETPEWAMTQLEWAEPTQFMTGGRYFVHGAAFKYRANEIDKKTGKPIGYNTAFCATGSLWRWIETHHKRIVKAALKQGLPVPERVLAEYPDLNRETK